MPLRTLLRFRNTDLTSDLNHRLRDLIGKGVFLGGNVLPVAGSLDVQVQSLGVVGADGMVTLLEGGAETVTCTAGITQWVVLRAYYVANDEPVAALEAISQLSYDALSDVEKGRRIKLASVTLSVSAVEVTTDDISFVGAERIDPVGRSPFRGNVSTRTLLPDWSDPETGLTSQNEPFDLYFVEDERIFYAWDTDGIHSWQPVISSQELLELNAHKENQDDGTVPPDQYNAQHVLKIHRDALDAGSASGTAFGAANKFMDAAFPTTITSRQDATGVAAETKVQLTGTFYVGTGGAGTADTYFSAAAYQQNAPLLGTDDRPITVASIRNTNDTAELDPSSDADALGYYTNPYVELDFTDTTDSDYTGNLSVFCGLKRELGQVLPSDGVEEIEGLRNVWVPDSVQWTGGTGSSIARLHGSGANAQFDATAGIVLNVATGNSIVLSVDGTTEATLDADSLLVNKLEVGNEYIYLSDDGVGATLSLTGVAGGSCGLQYSQIATTTYLIHLGVNQAEMTAAGVSIVNGLTVGHTTAPANDTLSVGDANLKLQLAGSEPVARLGFDTSTSIAYDRTADELTIEVETTEIAKFTTTTATLGDTNVTLSVSDDGVAVNSTTDGFFPPRMNTSERLSIAFPGAGCLVYDTGLKKLLFHTGTNWETISSSV